MVVIGKMEADVIVHNAACMRDGPRAAAMTYPE